MSVKPPRRKKVERREGINKTVLPQVYRKRNYEEEQKREQGYRDTTNDLLTTSLLYSMVNDTPKQEEIKFESGGGSFSGAGVSGSYESSSDSSSSSSSYD